MIGRLPACTVCYEGRPTTTLCSKFYLNHSYFKLCRLFDWNMILLWLFCHKTLPADTTFNQKTKLLKKFFLKSWKLENKAYYLGYFDGNFQFSWLFCQNTLRADLKFNPKVVFHIEFHGIFFCFLSKIWNSADFFARIRL